MQIVAADWVQDSFLSYSGTTYDGDILNAITQLENGYFCWNRSNASRASRVISAAPAVAGAALNLYAVYTATTEYISWENWRYF